MPHLTRNSKKGIISSEYSKSTNNPLKLNEFKVGENQVIIEHGNYLYMAVVFKGPGSITLHRVVKKTIQNIERRFGGNLEYWNGDMSQLRDIRFYILKLLPRKKIPISKGDDSDSTSNHPIKDKGLKDSANRVLKVNKKLS